jgi:hypothetical protein
LSFDTRGIGGLGRAEKGARPRSGRLALAAILLLSSCSGGGGSGSTVTSANPGGGSNGGGTSGSSGSAAAIPATFFTVNDTNPNDPPAVSHGGLGHSKLAWMHIEQTKGSFDFSFFDAYANLAPKASDGTAILALTLGLTPPWATSNQASCRTFGDGVVGCSAPPDNVQDWADFITALTNHFNGAAAPHIKYYELWNEASHANYWSGTPAQLAALAAAAYPIIKQDSHSLVVAPSMVGDARTLTSEAPAFLAMYLQAGGAQNSDLGAFHGYVAKPGFSPYPLPTEDCTLAGCNGSVITQVKNYRQILDQNGMKGKPLLDTEGGFLLTSITNPDTAAAWAAIYYLVQAGMFQTQNLEFVSWYTWGAKGIGSLEAAVGTPNEAGIAYNQVYDWLVGAAFSAPCSQIGSIWTCNLTRSGGYQAQIIWDSSQTCDSGGCTTNDQVVADTYKQYRGLDGGPATTIMNHTVPAAVKPIIVENQNP